MTSLTNSSPLSASFRDPGGFLFRQDGHLYRQVNIIYQEHYNALMSSGLYASLTRAGLLIPHEEVDIQPAQPQIAFKIIRPETVDFISYPYEWCFSQLKNAALTTLEIQKMALDHRMSLKDGSAYNIQFHRGKPVFIDTLSFEKYQEGRPWVAYKQFCQHFLAPLALMSRKDIRLNQLLRVYIDGIPLDLAGSLLPFRTRLSPSLLSHIHLNALSQKQFAQKPVKQERLKVSRLGLMGLIDSLESTIHKLKWQPAGTEWADYYDKTNYTQAAFEHKKQTVTDFLNQTNPASVWDLGANTGIFSRISAQKGILTVSSDIDPAAVERHYLDCLKRKETHILPLVIDLTNPSQGLGWHNRERMSLAERGPAGLVMALALVHHLAISNNVPLPGIAAWLSDLSRDLIIEFVPKNDSQVQRLLATREDIFTQYNRQSFEEAFKSYFTITSVIPIKESERTLYLMRKIS
jgi:hypothetical protein